MKKIPNHNFNSIKVRLEPLEGMQFESIVAFQFHKGAIRTGKGLAA